MKSLQIFLPILILIFVSINTKAQNQATCGFTERHLKLMETSEAYRNSVEATNKKINEIIKSNKNLKSQPPVYNIPVVVHVLYTNNGTEVGNISDAQIISAIDNMNDAYAGIIGASGNAEIEFCLATEAPDCSPTTGINRIDLTSFTANGDNYGTVGITDNNEIEVKAQAFWPAVEYYNIWVVTEINNNGGGAGTQGYAYFPGLGSIDRDGTVLLYNTMGYDPGGVNGYDLKSFTQENITLIHETGHYLNLYHTFADGGNETTCASNNPADCGTTGDFCCDTEPHLNPNSVCETGNLNTCTSSTYGDVVLNYMNYSPENCTDRFTADQIARMRATMQLNMFIDGDGFLSAGRLSISESDGCDPPTPVGTTTGYCSDETDPDKLANQIGTTEISIGSISLVNSSPLFDQDYYGTTNVQHCELTMHDVGATVSVNLDVEGITDIGDNFVHAKVYIDYNNDGDFDDTNPAEEVILLNGTNSDGGLVSGSFTVPQKSTFPDLVVNEPLKMRVVSDFTGQTAGTLINPCSVAYGQMEDMYFMVTNTLPVTITEYKASAKNRTSILSWQTSAEWEHDFFELQYSTDGRSFTHLSKVVLPNSTNSSLKNYEYVHHNPRIGNNYYKLIQHDLNGTREELGIKNVVFNDTEKVKIYPNPAYDVLQVDFNRASTETISNIEIFSYTGQKVYSDANINNIDDYKIDISDYAQGIYYFRIISSSGIDVQAITIVNRP